MKRAVPIVLAAAALVLALPADGSSDKLPSYVVPPDFGPTTTCNPRVCVVRVACPASGGGSELPDGRRGGECLVYAALYVNRLGLVTLPIPGATPPGVKPGTGRVVAPGHRNRIRVRVNRIGSKRIKQALRKRRRHFKGMWSIAVVWRDLLYEDPPGSGHFVTESHIGYPPDQRVRVKLKRR